MGGLGISPGAHRCDGSQGGRRHRVVSWPPRVSHAPGRSTGSRPKAEPCQRGRGVGRNKRGKLKPLNHFLPQARPGLELSRPWTNPVVSGKTEVGWESRCPEVIYADVFVRLGVSLAESWAVSKQP